MNPPSRARPCWRHAGGWALAAIGALGAALLLDPVVAAHHATLRALVDGMPAWLFLPLHHLHLAFYVAYAGLGLRAAWRRDRRTLRLTLLYLAAQLAIALLLVRVLKIGLGRPRPLAPDPAWWPLTLDSAHHSLPSGHAADAAVGAGTALAAGAPRGLQALALVATLLVLGMRVVELQHHPSDVVAGALLGGAGSWWLVRAGLARLHALAQGGR